VNGLCELGEADAFVAAAEIVEADEHGVVTTVFDLVFDDEATPVSVALWAFVILVMQIASAGDESVLTATSDEANGVVECLLVAHREGVADLLESTCRCAAQWAATHRLNINMAVADAIDEDGAQVFVNRPAVRLIVEIVGGDEAVQFRVVIVCPIDAVLMVAEREMQLGLVELVLHLALVIVETLEGCAEKVEGFVSGVDVVGVSATLEGSLADVITRQTWHVGVIAEVHNHVGLALDDVGTDPFQVNCRHSWLRLSVRDHQVCARFIRHAVARLSRIRTTSDACADDAQLRGVAGCRQRLRPCGRFL